MKKIMLYALSTAFFSAHLAAITQDPLVWMQQEIKHIVIVMMENRSFDNMAGWLYDEKHPPSQFIPEDAEPHYLGLSETMLEQFTNHLKNSKGELVYSSPPIKGIPSVSSTKFLNSPKFDPHEPFPNVQTQIFENPPSEKETMLGFLQDYATLWKEEDWIFEQAQIFGVMETYTEKETPIFHRLAKHYAISDYWFSSVPTQTNPNRAFTFCGTSEGEIINGSLGKNSFQSDTVWNRLEEKAKEVTWTIFWQTDMLPEIYQGPFSGPNTFARMGSIPNIEDHLVKLDTFHEKASKGNLPDISFIEPQWTISDNLTPQEKDFIDTFFPNQDFIFGFQGNDYHPPGDMRTGENFLANIYTSLIANPEAWSKTLLIVTFDEHGGLFDHIIPPPATPPDDHQQHGFSFNRFGVRIPTLLISPRINKNVVIRSDDSSIPFDHTSLIAMILKWKNLDKNEWNLGKRVEVAPTFEHVFTHEEARQDPILKQIEEEKMVNQDHFIHMGDPFCLKDSKGNYLCEEDVMFWHDVIPYLHKKIRVFTFEGRKGILTDGSFALIQSQDISLEGKNFLQICYEDPLCFFGANTHNPNQWWTIKNLDKPYIGNPISDGDRIYIENHAYLNIFQYVPYRLSRDNYLELEELKILSIVEENCEANYWFIEKLEL